MKTLYATAAAIAVACITATGSAAAVITPLTSVGSFTSPFIFSNDFETVKDTPQFSFDAGATLFPATGSTSGVTSSGTQVLGFSFPGSPAITATLNVDAFEVGMFFGNDVNYMGTVVLSVFDAGNVFLGSVTVNANGNDFADQFIGLRSDMAFRSASIDYPQSHLARVIDDFTIGANSDVIASVPEPGTLAILGLGLVGLGIARRKKSA